MNKETVKYVRWYLLVYVVLLVIYGIVQNFTICTDMKGFECNFNESKTIGFLTVSAYIITPIVAIIGFLSWKGEHNKNIIADEAKKLLISVDQDIYNITDLISNLKRFDRSKYMTSVYVHDGLFLDAYNKFNENLNYNDSLSYLVYELSEDDKFDKVRKNYNKATIAMQQNLNNNLQNNEQVETILDVLEKFRKNHFILNQVYKNNIKRLIFA